MSIYSMSVFNSWEVEKSTQQYIYFIIEFINIINLNILFCGISLKNTDNKKKKKIDTFACRSLVQN